LKALDHFQKRPMPTWGGDLSKLDLDNIFFYVKPSETESKSWDDVPEAIRIHSTSLAFRSRAQVPGWCRRAVRIGDGLP